MAKKFQGMDDSVVKVRADICPGEVGIYLNDSKVCSIRHDGLVALWLDEIKTFMALDEVTLELNGQPPDKLINNGLYVH